MFSALGSTVLAWCALVAVSVTSTQSVSAQECEGIQVSSAQGVLDAISNSTAPSISVCVEQDVSGCVFMPFASFPSISALVFRLQP